jgi:hypothetical protein
MPAQARHHHYLPQCYLKRFTRDGRRDSQLYTWDFRQKRMYLTSPRNVGGERDFNRVAIPGVAPDAIETAMSKVEKEFDTALTAFSANPNWEGNDELKNWIFNLMALMVVRSPQMRENRRRPMERTAKLIMDLLVSSEESWNRTRKPPREDGAPEISYEEAKRFHEEGKYTIEVPIERHIVDESKLIDTVLPLLARRRWTRLVATPQSGLFITSDNPVVLTWNHPDRVPPMHRRSPGFGMPDTTVHFAVSPRLAMFGTFDGEERMIKCMPKLTSLFNMHVLSRTYGRVFSAAPTIRLLDNAERPADLAETQLFADPAGGASADT